MRRGKSNGALCEQCSNMDTRKWFQIFKFKNSMCTLFSQQVGFFPHPEILLDNNPIKVVTEAKCFRPHIIFQKVCVIKPQNAIRFEASPAKNPTSGSPNFNTFEEIWNKPWSNR